MRQIDRRETYELALLGPIRWRALKRDQFLPRQGWQDLQSQRFADVVRYAFANVPIYQQKYRAAGLEPGDIQSTADAWKLPPVTKDELIAAYPDGAIAPQFKDAPLNIAVTGGTSGKTLRIAYSPAAMQRRVLTKFRIYSMILAGYMPWYVHTYVYTSPYPFTSLPLGGFPLHYISTLAPLDEVLQTISATRPHLLVIYPSRLQDVCQAMSEPQREQIRSRLIAINTKSEMSTEEQRQTWSRLFGVGVYDEYGSEEMNGTIAAQCPKHRYHVWEDLNYVEILDDQGQCVPEGAPGSLVCTNFTNYAMPMIRYHQGDTAALTTPTTLCACGRSTREITQFAGRSNAAFRLPSGRVVSSGYLLDVGYTRLLKYSDALNSWALIQERPDEVIFECIPGPGMTTDLRERLAKEVRELLFDEPEVVVKLVGELPQSSRGKRNQITSKVSAEPASL